MKTCFRPDFIVPALLVLALSGCGSESGTSGTAASTAASQPCIACHTSNSRSVSSVTGGVIVDEWKRSAHSTANAAACVDCHGRAHNHPDNCGQCHGGSSTMTARFLNPDAALQCQVCHGTATTIRPLSANHFNNITTPREIETTGQKRNGYPASFVTSKWAGQCRNCHNPHDPTGHVQRNVEWALSGHGDTKGEAWIHYDFKTRGNPGGAPATSTASDCVRCHTTTGYLNYVTSGFTDVHSWGDAADKTKEVLQCNACHDKSYNYASQRKLGAITAYYNYSSANTKKILVNHTFPDVGKSNICMCCHTGRESGLTLAAIAALPGSGAAFVNYSVQNFINSHYLTAGATIFGVSGYEYPTLDYVDPDFYAHKKIGVTIKSLGLGPCVSCHMQKTGDSQLKSSHRFKPVLTERTGVDCVGCHTRPSAFGIPEPIPRVITTEALLEVQKNGYHAALTVLASALRKRGFTFQSANPYFLNKNWQTRKGTPPDDTGGYGAGTGANTMGAAYNFNLLVHDPGGFAHNSTYAKRLLHDSILWVATGSTTLPPGQTIADVIADTTAIPPYSNLVASADGTITDFNTNSITIRNAATAWLTNDSLAFSRP